MEYKAFIVTPRVKRTQTHPLKPQNEHIQTPPPGVPPLAQKGSLFC